MFTLATSAAILLCSLAIADGVLGFDLADLPRKQGLPIQAIDSAASGPLTVAEGGLSGIGQVQFGHGSYFVTITLGEINLQVALDTGSSDLWVISTDCSSTSCHSLPAYPLSFHSPSFTSVNNNQTVFNISYTDGTSASGFVARENVTLYNITSANQAFALVEKMDLIFTDKVSGILGLGFSRLSSIGHSTPNGTSFLGSLAQDGILQYPIFGLSLTDSFNGSLTLGAIDSSIVNDAREIVWHEVVPFAPDNQASDPSAVYLHWALPLAAIMAGSTPISPIPSYPNIDQTSIALLDVGASGIFGPYQDVARLFSSLDVDSRLVNNGQWAVPCSTTITMAFSFGSSNQTITLGPEDYIIGVASGSSNLCLAWPQALPPNNLGIDWQFGTPFLRKVYSVYSYGIDSKESPMIGLMPLASGVNSTSQSTAQTATVASTITTTLPNFPLATSTSQSTSSYALNTSAGIPTLGSHPSTDLATSTYKPILQPLNASAIPTIAPDVSKITFIITDSAGAHTETSTSLIPAPSVPLGAPPGFGSANRISVSLTWTMSIAVTLAILLLRSLI